MNLSFEAAEVEEPDQRTLSSYRQLTINLWCELVAFDGGQVRQLIESIDSGDLRLADSFVTVRLPGQEPFKYYGTAYVARPARNLRGPYVWEGRPAGASEKFAIFVVESNDRTKGYFSSGDGMFRLSPSDRSDHYFLCKRNPDFSANTD